MKTQFIYKRDCILELDTKHLVNISDIVVIDECSYLVEVCIHDFTESILFVIIEKI